MNVSTLRKALLCMAAAVAAVLMFAATPGAQAQPCSPCPTYWVEYDYIFPPCTDTVFVDIDWMNGITTSNWSLTDGHITYPTPMPLSGVRDVRINGVSIPLGGIVKIPYTCGPLPNMCLECEVRCNPCLEIKIKLVPC